MVVVSKDDFRTNTYGGQVSEVPLDVAARLLARESHRTATEGEIADHHRSNREAKRAIDSQRVTDKVGTIMYLTPDGSPYIPPQAADPDPDPAKRSRGK